MNDQERCASFSSIVLGFAHAEILVACRGLDSMAFFNSGARCNTNKRSSIHEREAREANSINLRSGCWIISHRKLSAST